MQNNNYSKQRSGRIQGLRSLKDTLPKNIKKILNKRGQIYSEILGNWKFIVGEDLFKVCFPKSYRNTNKFTESTLVIMVKRGNEIEVEYSKKEIMNKINLFFNNSVVKRIKLASFNEERNTNLKKALKNENVTNNKYHKKIKNVKNEKIKKSLIELTKVFRKI
jgi:hypothetical protein